MAQTSNWIQELKEAAITIQYSVFGYMRLCETELSLNVIPSDIIYLVLLFYHGQHDESPSLEGVGMYDKEQTPSIIDEDDKSGVHTPIASAEWNQGFTVSKIVSLTGMTGETASN